MNDESKAALKIRYKMERKIREDGINWYLFDPSKMIVEYNGQRVEMLQELKLSIGRDHMPRLTMTFGLDEIDIDADTLAALHVFLDAKDGKVETDERD